jgi:hypothetical protein
MRATARKTLERLKHLTAPHESDSESEIISVSGEDDYVQPEHEPKDDDEPEEIAPKRKRQKRRTNKPAHVQEEVDEVQEPLDADVEDNEASVERIFEVANQLEDPDVLG